MTHQVIALARPLRAGTQAPGNPSISTLPASVAGGPRPDVAMMVALRYLAARRRAGRASFAKSALDAD